MRAHSASSSHGDELSAGQAVRSWSMQAHQAGHPQLARGGRDLPQQRRVTAPCRRGVARRCGQLAMLCFAAAFVTCAGGFSNPDTSKPPGRDLPSGDKLRIGVVRRVDVSQHCHALPACSSVVCLHARMCTMLCCSSPDARIGHARMDIWCVMLDLHFAFCCYRMREYPHLPLLRV